MSGGRELSRFLGLLTSRLTWNDRHVLSVVRAGKVLPALALAQHRRGPILSSSSRALGVGAHASGGDWSGISPLVRTRAWLLVLLAIASPAPALVLRVPVADRRGATASRAGRALGEADFAVEPSALSAGCWRLAILVSRGHLSFVVTLQVLAAALHHSTHGATVMARGSGRASSVLLLRTWVHVGTELV